MLRDCLIRNYQRLGTDWCEEVFDSKESLGIAVFTVSRVSVFEDHTMES